MILRTPPPNRKRRADSALDHESPVSDRRLVIYEDPVPVSSHDPSDQMVCTYDCRQLVKSEVMDALSLAEKQVIDYQSRVETLEKDLTRSEEERKSFKDNVGSIEQELAASKGREQALQQQLLMEVTNFQERFKNEVLHSSELEVQLRKETVLRKGAESSAAAAKDKILELEEKAKCILESSEREKKHLKKEISHLQDEGKLSCSRLSAELERMKMKADNATKESELLKKQMEELRERLNECLVQKNDLEHKVSSLAVPSNEVVALTEAQTLVKHLQEELRNYEAEVREARKLKSFHANTQLLKEKLLEEKGRREKAEAEIVKLEEVQLHAEKLENELKMWKSLIDVIPGVFCFNDIPQKIVSLQKEAIESTMKVGEVTARLKELEIALESANLCRQQAETECALAKEKVEESNLEVKRLKLMIGAVTEERDRLRKDAANKLRNLDSEGGTANVSVLKELESSLTAKEEIIKALENDLHKQGEIINRQHDELKVLNENISNEARRIKSLERESDRLHAEISLLESKLGHGDYSTESTKVLRMVNTLTVDSETKHTIEALRSELQKAKAKLQAVEELKGQSDVGNLIDAQISDKLAQLKGQIATLEKREERYKAVFAEKISVFRRACCSLFGYKIVMDDQQQPNGIPVTQFTLQSIYAQSDDEKLEFEYESGNTNILANDYTSQPDISHQVEIFIRKMNSIPAFTANLTMESFNKRTLS